MRIIHRSIFALLCLCVLAAIAVAPGCRRSPEEKKARYMEAGRRYMEKKDYARAILEFKNAVRIAPRQPEPYYRLALAFLASGDGKSAVALLRKTVELDPRHSGGQLKLAELMAASGDKEIAKEAEKRAGDVLARTPGDPEALDVLALAELQLGKREDAERHLLEALNKSPRRLRSALNVAKIRLARKDYSGAEEILKKAASETPPQAAAIVTLGELYIVLRRIPEAEEQLKRALQIEPQNARALLQLAGLQARGSRIDEAGNTIRELSKLPQKEYRPAYGQFLFQTGKRDAAIAEFERLAREDPSDRNVRSRLVAAYSAVGRQADAERILTAALKQNAKDADALLQRSKLYLLSERFEDAQKDLNQVIHYRADSAEAHYLLAQVHERRGAELSQRQELSEAVKLNPGLLDARIRLSKALIASGAAKASLDIMEQTPRWQQNAVSAIVQHNWALLATGDKARARKTLDAALALSRAPDLLVQDAVLRLDAKDYTGARASLEEALKLKPDHAQAVELLARSYASQNQPAAALEKVRLYAAQAPQSARLQNLLGQLLAASGKRDEARKAFTAAKAADPRLAAADLALAQLDLAEGKPDSARKTLEALLSARPNLPAARLLLGTIEEKTGRRDAAIEQYRKVLDFDPRNLLALNNIAFLLAEHAGKPDEALKYAQQAKELAPNSAAIDDTLGWVFYRKGIYFTARRHLESAAREPTAIRKYHLAMAYLKSGDDKRGRQALEESLKLDPNLAEARAARQGVPGGSQ